jgi:hypothetical protein
MSDEIIESTTTEVATVSWEEAIAKKAAEQAAMRGQLSNSVKFLSFRSGQLSIDGVALPDNKLQVVVLTFIAENAYYKGKFDPTVSQTPLCYALYNSQKDMWPSDSVKEKQADTCAECPNFEWGSDPQGGKGKACKTRYRIAVIPAPTDASLPMHIQGSELRFATIPVTSVKNFEQFMSKAELVFSRPMFGVVTEMSVIPDPKTQYVVNFTPISKVAGELMLPMLARIEDAEAAITYDMGAADEETTTNSTKQKPLK